MDRCCVAEGGWRLKCRAIDEKMVDKRGFSLGSDEDVRDYFGKQGNFFAKSWGCFAEKFSCFAEKVGSCFYEGEKKGAKGEVRGTRCDESEHG